MLDTNLVVGEGFEPSKSVTADLQSAPFGRSGTPPDFFWCRQKESNPRPTDYKSVALPTELCRHQVLRILGRADDLCNKKIALFALSLRNYPISQRGAQNWLLFMREAVEYHAVAGISSTVGVTGTAPPKPCLPLNNRTPAAAGAAAAEDRNSGSQFLTRG